MEWLGFCGDAKGKNVYYAMNRDYLSGADMACLERQGLGLGLSRDFSRTYLRSQIVDSFSAYLLGQDLHRARHMGMIERNK